MKPAANIYDASQTRDISKLAPAKGSTMSADIEFDAWQRNHFASIMAHLRAAGNNDPVLSGMIQSAIKGAWEAARATPQTPTCQHRVADARNQYVESGYLCMDCGAVFAAADHAPQAPTPAAAEGQAERDWPLNEELEELWNETHCGHPADFAADVLERWGGCPAGLLGHGGALSKKPVAHLPRQAAVQGEQATGKLIADLYEFTKYAACSQRRNTGDFLDGLFKQIEDLQPRCAAAAPTVKASQ